VASSWILFFSYHNDARYIKHQKQNLYSRWTSNYWIRIFKFVVPPLIKNVKTLRKKKPGVSWHLTSRCVINEMIQVACQCDITNLCANSCCSFPNKATCFSAYCAVVRQYVNIRKDVLYDCYYVLTLSAIGVRCQTSYRYFHSVSVSLNIFFSFLLTHSTQHSPSWENIRFSDSQVIPHIILNPKIHYRIHKGPPNVPIISQLDPVHNLTSHFLKIHLNIILPSTPGSAKWSLSLRFPHQKPVYVSHLPHMRYMPGPYILYITVFNVLLY